MDTDQRVSELLEQIRISQNLIREMEIQALKNQLGQDEWIELIELEKYNLAGYREELGELYALPL